MQSPTGSASLRVRLSAGKLFQGGSTPSTILTQEPREPFQFACFFCAASSRNCRARDEYPGIPALRQFRIVCLSANRLTSREPYWPSTLRRLHERSLCVLRLSDRRGSQNCRKSQGDPFRLNENRALPGSSV